MAFNFNWSPLTADADFYRRARDLLTTALNKTPKPPIIVDDILVTELNLGSVPPELEILEIGDLAEDRFRGIFKMCYTGDAFLTLKTRVEANPLNTYLDSKPTFTSPQPLAAASSLTIPLSITLSEIKLSAFIIIVFSKQKGLTLVFRNDPLESLKVSSTFDSIQFVRDYLQRTIEGQLRSLMMNELPSIIHKLSLSLWCPDQSPRDDKEEECSDDDELSVDPLASPPIDPVDANGNLLDPTFLSQLSLNGGAEVQSLFSQNNLLKLSALSESNRTLSLFTSHIKDVVYRAGQGSERTEANTATTSTPAIATPNLTRSPSLQGSSTTYTFSDSSSVSHGHLPARPSLVSMNSATTGLALGSGSRQRSFVGRKKKTRVVNLRRSKTDTGEPSDEMAETQSDFGEEGMDTVSIQAPMSEPAMGTATTPRPIPEEHQDDDDDNSFPSSKVRFMSAKEKPSLLNSFPMRHELHQQSQASSKPFPAYGENAKAEAVSAGSYFPQPTQETEDPSVSPQQAWIMKMADEIARRVYDEKQRQQGGGDSWREADDAPPPAYSAAR